jgi:hypothetical protein
MVIAEAAHKRRGSGIREKLNECIEAPKVEAELADGWIAVKSGSKKCRGWNIQPLRLSGT